MKLKDCHDGGICLNEMLIEDMLAALQMAAQVMALIGLGGDLRDTDEHIQAKAMAAFEACDTAITAAEVAT